ncbi:MAG: hypothetical protein MUP36_02105, partial [Demequinaceae bacterium]|nr:hypothetical protein [Demequinaceae bacterium]
MSRPVWPLRLAAREGVDTARTGRWTSLLVVLAVAWASAVPGAADAVGVTQLVEDEHSWVEAGGHVFVVEGARTDGMPNPIPAPACERLNQYEGIDASFALTRTNASGSLSHIPGARPTLYEVTPGVYQFLGLEPDVEGTVIATSGFARRTGVMDGDPAIVIRRAGFGVSAMESDLIRLAVADASIMGEEFDGAFLVPSLVPETANACYVRTDAAHHTAVAAALPGLLSYNGKPAIPNPRLFSGEFTVDYTTAYEDRPLRWVWVATAGALGLLWGIVQWFRRSQIAIYATFGAKAKARLVMQATEWGVLAGIGAVWGWSLGVLGSIAFGARASEALTAVSFHTLLTVLG